MISIVDDDQSVREAIVDLVSAMGFHAEAFEHAEHYLQSGNLAGTACLITDMCMPGMTGLELHEQLVAAGNAIPTILITAFPKDVDRVRAMRNGIVHYLSKPFDETQLSKCMASAISSRRTTGKNA